MENSSQNIVDQFGREHTYLRVSLTERCNLRCFYCMPEEGIPLKEKSSFMSAEETISIVKRFVDLGVKKVRLTGGEPLIKKGIDKVLLALGEMPIEVGITTNAVVLDKYFDVLKKSGINALNISLDSLEEEKFNLISRRNYFKRIYTNILKAIDLGFKVKVNVVVIRGVNDNEVVDFVLWTKDKNVQVRFIEFMPFDGNKWDEDKKVSQQEMLNLIEGAKGISTFHKIDDAPNDTARNYQLDGGIGSFGFISSVSNPFCDSCNRLRLTADGKMKNCLFSQSETDLLSSFRNDEDIAELIQRTVYFKKKNRGGIVEFNKEYLKSNQNRSMVSIGG